MRAVTFDFWDTIVLDDSDEPIRAERGLKPKSEARRDLFVDEILAHSDFSRERAIAAYEHLNAVFRQQWKKEHFTPHISERLLEGYSFLEIEATPDRPQRPPESQNAQQMAAVVARFAKGGDLSRPDGTERFSSRERGADEEEARGQ